MTGKSIWRGEQNEEVTVEKFALQHYNRLGYKGYVPNDMADSILIDGYIIATIVKVGSSRLCSGFCVGTSSLHPLMARSRRRTRVPRLTLRKIPSSTAERRLQESG